MRHTEKRVAVFDIDGTIFRSSLLIELVDALIQEGIFPPEVGQTYANAYMQWLNRKGSYETYIMSVVAVFNMNIKGVAYDDFLRIAEQVVSFHRHRIYKYTRDLIRNLRKKKYYLLAISHSPKVILDPFCKKLGFNKVYGMLYEIDAKNWLTGMAVHRDLMINKAEILKRAVEKERLTLVKSIGVGDTDSDISFLKLTEQQICFNPNEKLYKYARRNKWKIVVERKDVIYAL